MISLKQQSFNLTKEKVSLLIATVIEGREEEEKLKQKSCNYLTSLKCNRLKHTIFHREPRELKCNF